MSYIIEFVLRKKDTLYGVWLSYSFKMIRLCICNKLLFLRDLWLWMHVIIFIFSFCYWLTICRTKTCTWRWCKYARILQKKIQTRVTLKKKSPIRLECLLNVYTHFHLDVWILSIQTRLFYSINSKARNWVQDI